MIIWWLVRLSVVNMRRQLWPDDHNIKYYLYYNFLFILHKFIHNFLRKKLLCDLVYSSLYGRVPIACAFQTISWYIIKYITQTSRIFLFHFIWYGNGGDIVKMSPKLSYELCRFACVSNDKYTTNSQLYYKL